MNNTATNTINDLLDLFQIEKLLIIALGIGAIVIFVRLLNQISQRLADNFTSKRLLILQISTIISFFLYTFGILGLIYTVLAPPQEMLIAFGGSIAVAIGFALKDITASIVAGFILLFDKPFQVGDRVQYNETYGEVVSIGLRTVRLNTLDDNLVTIPNSKFLVDAVASGNSGQLHMMVTASFYISTQADIDEAQEILHEVVTSSRYAYLSLPVSIVFEEIEICHELAIKMTAKAYVLDVKYEKAFQSDIVKRVAKSFKKNQVKRPQFRGVVNA